MFRGFVLHQRTAVLLGIFLMFTVTHADQIPLVGVENINNFAQHSAVGPNQMCYYAEAGSSTIQIFDKNLQIVGSFSVLSKDGIKLPVYSIRYENELFISTAAAGDIHVYAVDPQTGKATYRYTERSSGDNSPKKITLSSSNRIPMDPAYESWKEERHAEGNLDAIVSSLCNTLVCVQIDEDGDFNIGTADGTNLLYRYPNDPWSSDIRIYVNGAFWELTNEAGICGGPTAQFINWTNDGTSIHCTYSIATTLPLVDVEVIHTPVMFGAAAGAILTETIVTNTSIEPLEVGVLYEYDTDVDMDDNARLFLGPNEQLVETCHDAPYSASYWDAVPASGTIVGRGTFNGAMAVTPDWMAFGQWDDFQNTCWERTCDGEPYGDSAVLYRWNAAMLGVGEQRRVATYYGVGEIVTEPGELQLSIVQPDIQCEAFGVRPDPFTLIVNITNTGASPCSNVSVNTVSNGGPGGSATILGANPITIGTLNPGANAAVSYEIDLSAAPEGGCVLFDVFASSDDCANNQILDFCVDVPPCVVEPGECCLDIVFAVDTTGSMAEAIDNIRTELPNIIAAANAASGGDVRLGLVTFGDEVRAVNGLTFDQATVSAGISALMAASGGGEPEASDEALREIITHNGQCTYGNEFIGEFRENCEYENVNLVKLIILITDARPAGCNDLYEPGVDDVNAHARALDAAAGNILITPIFVPTYFSGPFETTIETIMTDYATTTGGHYTRVNANGSGTGEAITDIIENCGEPPVEDECGGPRCNTGETIIGYAFGDAPILDATIRTTSSGMLVANWSPLPEANFYQLYWNYENDSPANWTRLGSPTHETTYSFNPHQGEDGQAVFIHVRGLPANTMLLGQDIGCWPMDEGTGLITVDLAQGNDGEIVGAEWITGPSGNAGLHFGYGDYITLDNDFQFYGQPLQVEACVTIEEYPIIQTGSYYIFSCHRYAQWFQGFGLRIDVGGRVLSQVWDESINNWQTLWAQNLPEFLVPLNEPFLVTAVIRGPESMILVNGNIVAIGNQPYNSITNGFNMTIGAHNYNQDRYQYHMRGDIHWLKISELE